MEKKLEKNKKVLLGLSGGVDSTAATLLLQKDGYEVTGMFFDVLGNQEKEKAKAEHTAKELGIDFIYRDVSKKFREKVIDYFCQSYHKGETPNPCVKCNPTIKFLTMEEEAERIGAYYLATGHYAQVEYKEDVDKYFIKKAENKNKDQSYMLYGLGQDILSRLILPLGTKHDKEQVRSFLREEGLSNAELKDSQEICFIKDGNYVEFIKDWNLRNLKNNSHAQNSKPGKFIDEQGKTLGEHQGIVNYTIGQRKGLGITFGKPVFVVAMDEDTNTATLGEQEGLFKKDIPAKDAFFVGNIESYKDKVITGKIRYASVPAETTIEIQSDSKLIAHFKEPQRAATPGQSIVFYHGDILIGGGVICK